jgi:hypothetical protein
MSLAEIKTAIEQLSFEERAQLAAWMHSWKDDEWDPPPSEAISHYGVAGDQMKRDIADGKLDDVLREVEDYQDRPAPRNAVNSRTHRPFSNRFDRVARRLMAPSFDK